MVFPTFHIPNDPNDGSLGIIITDGTWSKAVPSALWVLHVLSLRSKASRKPKTWPRPSKGRYHFLIKDQTRMFAWWSNLYCLSIWVFGRLACFTHTVSLQVVIKICDRTLAMKIVNKSMVILPKSCHVYHDISCYIHLYTIYIYIYSVCVCGYIYIYIIYI